MKGNFCYSPFWDLNTTWGTDIPLFTPCFEDTVFVLAPCVIFSLILLLNICYLPRHLSYSPLPWTYLNIAKLTFAVSLLLLSILWFGLSIYETFYITSEPLSAFVASCARVITFVLVIATQLRHKAYGVITSTTVSLFWICFAMFSIVLHRSSILNYYIVNMHPPSTQNFVLSMVYYPLIYIEFILSIFADKKTHDSLNNGSPLREASFLCYVTFTWFNRTVYKSMKKLLDVGDFLPLDIKLQASYLHETLSNYWKFNSVDGRNHDASLAWSLLKAFWPWITAALFLEMTYMLTMLLPPLILDRIIDFVDHNDYAWRGYFYAVALFVNKLISRLILNNFDFLLFGTGAQIKSALIGAIFRKVLRVTVSARKDYSCGALVNLISVDVERILEFCMIVTVLFVAPVKVILILFIMWQYLGIASLAGVVVIVILVALTFYISRINEGFMDEQMETKDTRLKYMNEILNGIKVLKFYAWEIPFTSKVSEIRKEEIRLILKSQLCYVGTLFVINGTPFLVALTCFTTFLLIDPKNVLDPTRAFVSINLMEQLRYALFEIPEALSQGIQTKTSVERIRNFLIADDINPDVVGSNPDERDAVTIKKASLSWTSDTEWKLKDIDLHVRKRHLIAVIGPVGSGKSSLLSAILGEMCKIKGSIDLKGSVAYVPQQAWILNRTLKDNILLVKNMKEEKYNKILDRCCLRPDLDILPEGDETEIGEKGVNLSGGQKQRISLARSVFQDKDIYLLDDPLSAVDVHVRKSLFEDVIGNEGLLRKKTRILVTHDVSFLSKVDLIVSMKDGTIDEIGSYHELLERKGSFADFAEEHTNVEITEEDSRNFSRMISTDSSSAKNTYERSISEEPSLRKRRNTLTETSRTRLTEDEKMEIGGVKRGVYWNYVQHASWLLLLISFLAFIAFAAFEAGSNIWLSKWTTVTKIGNETRNSSATLKGLYIYAAIGGGQVLSTIVGSVFLVYAATRASVKYHLQMLESIMKCPMSFFDSTPLGRIMNRFGSDMDIIDTQIIYSLEGWMNCLLSAVAAFVVIGMNTPLFLAFLLPIGIIYYFLLRLQLNVSRQIKRLEATSRSPLYSHFMESVQGVSSIKAYNIQEEFTEKLEEHLNKHILCCFNTAACNGWCQFCLDTLSSLIILVATILAIQERDTLQASVVALLITYAMTVSDSLPWLVKMNSELENKSISIERLSEYCNLTAEAPWTQPNKDPSPEWPQNGQIIFSDYSTRYRQDLDLVLEELDLVVDKNEKVGIVGRTGAGKSSVTLALFRIIEPVDGTILIDHIDISKIGLHALRKKLTIIPQDPILFTGSLRFNLDPNMEYKDEDIWESLEQSHLKTFVSNLSDGLEYEIEEGGQNLSAGQRQLMCLSRALLKKTKILILDEATASVDMDTDAFIQSTIRTAFENHTIITIAHRLKTVIDYDKIVVMDNGKVIEVGNPTGLLENTESKFYEMCKDAGLI